MWAQNTTWLKNALLNKFSTEKDKYQAVSGKKVDPERFREVITNRADGAFVCTATPMVLNQRLSLQQGVFLCPSDVTCSWSDNLDGLGWTAASQVSQAWVLNISLAQAYEYLQRVNITARSLFPGLDGYGEFMFGRAHLLMGLEVPDDWTDWNIPPLQRR